MEAAAARMEETWASSASVRGGSEEEGPPRVNPPPERPVRLSVGEVMRAMREPREGVRLLGFPPRVAPPGDEPVGPPVRRTRTPGGERSLP